MNSVTELNAVILIKSQKQKLSTLTKLSIVNFCCYLLLLLISFGMCILGFLIGWLAFNLYSTNYFLGFFCVINALLLFKITDLLIHLAPYPKTFYEINDKTK